MFSKLISSGLYHSMSALLTLKKEKNMIIDPLSCLIKLSILNFYPEGTKISITENQVSFNEPTFYQGTIRYFYGQGREDLHNLYNPIQKCINWYWDENNEEILFLFNLAITGLQKLIVTYSSNCTIKHTLDYYIDTIKSKKISKGKQTDNENKIHGFLKEIWSEREIHVVIQLLQELQEKKYLEGYEHEGIHLLQSINVITTNKEEKLSEFIKNHITVL